MNGGHKVDISLAFSVFAESGGQPCRGEQNGLRQAWRSPFL